MGEGVQDPPGCDGSVGRHAPGITHAQTLLMESCLGMWDAEIKAPAHSNLFEISAHNTQWDALVEDGLAVEVSYPFGVCMHVTRKGFNLICPDAGCSVDLWLPEGPALDFNTTPIIDHMFVQDEAHARNMRAADERKARGDANVPYLDPRIFDSVPAKDGAATEVIENKTPKQDAYAARMASGHYHQGGVFRMADIDADSQAAWIEYCTATLDALDTFSGGFDNRCGTVVSLMTRAPALQVRPFRAWDALLAPAKAIIRARAAQDWTAADAKRAYLEAIIARTENEAHAVAPALVSILKSGRVRIMCLQ